MNPKTYEYDAVIQASEVGAGGAYVVFPFDVRAEFGKGRVKVHATFDGEPYDGSIVNMGVKNPDGSICYIIGIRKDIRTIIGKGIGDIVHVSLSYRPVSEVLIRPLRADECDLVKDFFYFSIHVPPGMEPLPFDIVNRPELRHYWERFGWEDGDLGIVATRDEVVIGIAWSRILGEPTPGYGYVGPNIPEVCVSLRPEVRGQGHGTSLMLRLLFGLGMAGYRQVSLSVDKTNEAGHLYKRLGFVPVQENEEDFVMVKTL